MVENTRLDVAHAAMQADPSDEPARLRFYERLADAELFLMLSKEPDEQADSVEPELFELQDARYVLVFDREDRLAVFAGKPTPYVALSGRNIVAMLAGQEIGIGVNLDVAPSSILLPDTAVTWLHDTLGNIPDEADARIAQVDAPKGLPDQLITALDAKLASAMGLADCAVLAGVVYADGTKGHLLAYIDALPQAQGALTRAVAEALTFSGIEAGALDVVFVSGTEAVAQHLHRVGLRFDLPQMQSSAVLPVQPPGGDPDKPPKLR